MEGHEERAAEAEYELSEMEDRSDKLAEDIESAKADWAQKQQDGSVPGAGTNEDVDGADTRATGEGTPVVEDEDEG